MNAIQSARADGTCYKKDNETSDAPRSRVSVSEPRKISGFSALGLGSRFTNFKISVKPRVKMHWIKRLGGLL